MYSSRNMGIALVPLLALAAMGAVVTPRKEGDAEINIVGLGDVDELPPKELKVIRSESAPAPRAPKVSRYMPHQGKREMARRVRQMAKQAA